MERLSKSALMVRLNHLKNIVKCGTHSGFPPCCIQYYITVHMWRSDLAMVRYCNKAVNRGIEVRNKAPGYIPCPSCLEKGKFIRVRKCPAGHCNNRNANVK
jgi:hypothetical protein